MGKSRSFITNKLLRTENYGRLKNECFNAMICFKATVLQNYLNFASAVAI